MCEDPGIHLLRPHMWCLEIGNRSNVIKRVRKRCTHLNHMQITVKKKNCTVCAVCDYKIGLTLRGRPIL